MKKWGKRWVWAAVATVVACAALALVFRERHPYEFLHGAVRAWTIVTQSPAYEDLCETQYESALSVSEVAEKARKELSPQGWECIGNAFYTPRDNAERIMVYSEKPSEYPPGKTVIRIERIASQADRFNAWLDRVMGR